MERTAELEENDARDCVPRIPSVICIELYESLSCLRFDTDTDQMIEETARRSGRVIGNKATAERE